jgi:hypothetical protein
VLGREEQIATDTLKVSMDAFLRADAFHASDRRAGAVAGQASAVHAVQTDHLAVAVVDDIREVRRCHSGLAAARCSIVDEDDGPLVPREQIGGRDASNACPDDTDIGRRILGQRRLAIGMGRLQAVSSHKEVLFTGPL